MRAHPLQFEPLTRSPGQEGNVAKEDRGFASMDRAKQREIASKGGKAAHQKGTAHEWTSEEARDAGRKGGIASHQRRREQAGSPNQNQDENMSGDTNSEVAREGYGSNEPLMPLDREE
jgi:uncharacterized protein